MSAQTFDQLDQLDGTTEAPARPGLPRQRAVAPQPAPHLAPHLALVPDAQPVRRVRTDPLSSTPAVQLTRRGRLVVLGVLLALGAVLAFVVTGLLDRAPAAPTSRPPTRTVVVQPGQTLWSIAREVAPTTDRRDVIARIVDLNALPSTDVAAGTRLAVPTR